MQTITGILGYIIRPSIKFLQNLFPRRSCVGSIDVRLSYGSGLEYVYIFFVTLKFVPAL